MSQQKLPQDKKKNLGLKLCVYVLSRAREYLIWDGIEDGRDVQCTIDFNDLSIFPIFALTIFCDDEGCFRLSSPLHLL